MTHKDNDNRGIPKKVLEWLTGISAIATILTAIFSILPENAEAKLWLFGAAVGLGLISIGIYFYQRRREARLKIAESLEPLSASAALRGLLPFEEGDALPGRGQDVQELFTLVSSRSFRFGVLWGESGCGKTSLLRAGLVPRLRNDKFLPLYINKPTNNPIEAIRAALQQEDLRKEKQTSKSLDQLLKSAAPKDKQFVILFDQFEEFFLINRTPKSRPGFIRWLGECIADEEMPVVFLLCIRADFFAQLQNFAPQIPEPTSIHTTYQLQNFDTEQAKQIFSAAAKTDGIPFEPELIQALIRELEEEEFIRPAELQVVGTRLKRKHVFTLNRYEALGGARGILSSYISDVIKQCPNEQTARLVLRMICPDTVETRLPADLSMDDILQRIDGEGNANQPPVKKAREVQTILNQFVNARVLIFTDDNKYNLAHDYLAPYVRAATEGTETETERANQSLKRYVAEYKDDPRLRIPFWRIRWIQRYASAEVKSAEKARQLIKKSTGATYRIIYIPLILTATLYLFLASSYYFGVDQDNYIVVLSGNPQLKVVPGFDQVLIQTDFHVGVELEPKFQRDILGNGLVGGHWFRNSKAGYDMWGENLAKRFEPISQARAFRLLGQPDQSAAVLLELVIGLSEPNRPTADPDLRTIASESLSVLIQAQPEVVTSELLSSLIEIMLDPGTDPDVRSNTVEALGVLAPANPAVVTSEMLSSLIDNILASGTDPDVRSNAAYALSSLAQANPEAVTSEMLSSLIDNILASGTDPDVRSNAAYALSSLAQANPEAVTSEMLSSLLVIVLDSNIDSDMYSLMAYALSSLAQANPEAVTSEMLSSLEEIVRDTGTDPDVRSNAADALGTLAPAQPEMVTSEMLSSLLVIALDSDMDLGVLMSLAEVNPKTITSEMISSLIDNILDAGTKSDVSSNAAFLLRWLAPANPEAVTSEMLSSLIEIVRDSRLDLSLRSNAAYALSSLAPTNSEVVTSAVLSSLIEIVRDSRLDSSLRSNTADALGALAPVNPEAVTSEMLSSLEEIVRDSRLDPSLRSDAADALSALAPANPEAITSRMLSSLLVIVRDSRIDPSLRSNVVYALSALAQANRTVVTVEMLFSLLEILFNSGTAPDVRSNAADALSSLAQANPETVTSEMLSSLIDSILDAGEDPNVLEHGAVALSSLAQANPEAVTSEMLSSLNEIIRDSYEDLDVRNRALHNALIPLAQANPEAVTSEMLSSLIEIARDSEEQIDERSNMTIIVSYLAQAKPKAVTSEMLSSLIEIILDSDLTIDPDFDVRSNAATALSLLVQAQPKAVTSEMVSSMIDSILDAGTDPNVRLNAAQALGWLIQARPEAVTSSMMQSLIALLQSETDSLGRLTAGYTLFWIDLQDIDQEEIIRKEVGTLRTSPRPHLRMAANQLLEMLAISDLVEEAHSHPERIERIISRLEDLTTFDDKINEPLLKSAAAIVLPEIEKIGAENK